MPLQDKEDSDTKRKIGLMFSGFLF